MQVTVTRRQDRFRRAINGPWLHSSTEAESMVMDEEGLKPHDVQYPHGIVRSQFSLGSGITVTWSDGTKEHAFHGNGGVVNYPPVCIPHDGRLSKLLNAPVATPGEAAQ